MAQLGEFFQNKAKPLKLRTAHGLEILTVPCFKQALLRRKVVTVIGTKTGIYAVVYVRR